MIVKTVNISINWKFVLLFFLAVSIFGLLISDSNGEMGFFFGVILFLSASIFLFKSLALLPVYFEVFFSRAAFLLYFFLASLADNGLVLFAPIFYLVFIMISGELYLKASEKVLAPLQYRLHLAVSLAAFFAFLTVLPGIMQEVFSPILLPLLLLIGLALEYILLKKNTFFSRDFVKFDIIFSACIIFASIMLSEGSYREAAGYIAAGIILFLYPLAFISMLIWLRFRKNAFNSLIVN